jgi:hypothetical protein
MKRSCCLAVLWIIGVLLSGSDVSAGEKSNRTKKPEASIHGDRLVIHEWGTFTSLQDEAGNSIVGVNTDDEPVPEFVHRISELIPRPSELAPVYYKGVPRSHRQVRMRLETPVLYFYPPAGARQPLQANVQVGFRGGWLTEYFPQAKVAVPGLENGNFNYSGLSPKTMGTLEWNDVTIGGDYPVPATDAQVWLAPRQVRAATVKTGEEAEKYLFYRGVGNVRSLLTVTRTSDDDGLVIRENLNPELGLRAPLSIRAMWLVHVRDDGAAAFRRLGSVNLTGDAGRELARTPVSFSNDDRLPGNPQRPGAEKGDGREVLIDGYSSLAELRGDMRKALIADGLYADEADAMLKTWELAYFKSPGLRLFYLLPQQWTDAVLPLQCSLLAHVSRTMVGRVELVTPRQRRLLKKLGIGAVSQTNWLYENARESQSKVQILARLWEGKARFQDLGIPVPPDYQSYIDLGRFRNALILDEFSRHPDSGIGRFAEAYNLEYYTPEDDSPRSATAQND